MMITIKNEQAVVKEILRKNFRFVMNGNVISHFADSSAETELEFDESFMEKVIEQLGNFFEPVQEKFNSIAKEYTRDSFLYRDFNESLISDLEDVVEEYCDDNDIDLFEEFYEFITTIESQNNKKKKLVRDKIPNIILRDTGVVPDIEVVEDRAIFYKYLKEKLVEEVNEYIENQEVEELCDIEEVIRKLVEYHDLTNYDFKEIRKRKNKEKGKFNNRFILIQDNEE